MDWHDGHFGTGVDEEYSAGAKVVYEESVELGVARGLRDTTTSTSFFY